MYADDLQPGDVVDYHGEQHHIATSIAAVVIIADLIDDAIGWMPPRMMIVDSPAA